MKNYQVMIWNLILLEFEQFLIIYNYLSLSRFSKKARVFNPPQK